MKLIQTYEKVCPYCGDIKHEHLGCCGEHEGHFTKGYIFEINGVESDLILEDELNAAQLKLIFKNLN